MFSGKVKNFLQSGHAPTLFSAFLYFDFCFAIWVLNGAMAPFISEEFGLSPAEKGFMISVPIMAGALMRFPLGVLSQYIGRKNAALVEMGLLFFAMLYGYFMVHTYNDVLIMGVLLGIAGASFGVALSLGSGWFPPKYKGLAMGIAGAGNSGTVLAVLLAPPLATVYGWKVVYGFGALFMLIPIIVMIIFAKEPPDREHQSFKEHIQCLWEKDGWVFNFVYIITFGGFIGLSNFLPTYFHDQFGVSKIEAGQLTMLAALMGSGIRILGGHVADRMGGITALTHVISVVILLMVLLGFHTNIVATTIFFMICFAMLGAGNGALFQMVPLRWPASTAIAGSMIGEIGALGGSIIPNAMGLSKQYSGTFLWGFVSFSIIAVIALVVLRVAQKKWTRTWVEEGGKARTKPPVETITVSSGLETATRFLKTIIYPVGNSELAEKATNIVGNLCKISGGKAVLVYVEGKFHNSGMMTDSKEWEQIRDNWIVEGKKILERESQRLQAMSIQNIDIEIRHGNVSDEIVAAAEERKADMIVLASHQHSPMGSLLMGNRTYDVFKKATCPILRIVR
ncbi:MAG: MFS transporter [Ignavibacteriales bacterium]|nr:MFS transporter [Ignavibacteriales bacterium]